MCQRLVALLALLIARTSLGAATVPDAVRTGEQRQQQIRSRVQQVAQQLDSIISEFEQNGLGDGEDVRSLRAIRLVLGDLSDREMEQVIALLRQARASSTDDATSRRNAGDAYVTQQAILARLRGLLAEFHRQQSLQELASRLAALAARQGVNLRSAVELARTVGSRTPEEFPESANESLRVQATAQGTLNADVNDAVEVMRYLSDKADGPAALRLRQAIAAVDESKLSELLADALTDLRGANLYRAATNEKSVRDMLVKVAAMLGPQPDALSSLRAAADDLDRLIEQQKQLADQTKQARTRADLVAAESKQAEIVQSTDAAKESIEPRAPAAAETLDKALDAMQQARAAMLDKKASAVAEKQAAALAELERARAQLNERIAQAQAQAERDRQAKADANQNPTTRDSQAQSELQQKQQQLGELLDQIKSLQARQQKMTDATAAPSATRPSSASAAADQKKQAVADAPKQKQLAGDARAAQQHAGDREQPDAAKHLADAAKQMDQAADAMSRRDAASANSEQQDAADALARAADAVAQAQQQLDQAKRDLEHTQKSREEVAQLIKDQQAIDQQTAQAAAEQPKPDDSDSPQSDKQAGQPNQQDRQEQREQQQSPQNQRSPQQDQQGQPAQSGDSSKQPEQAAQQKSQQASEKGEQREQTNDADKKGANAQPSQPGSEKTQSQQQQQPSEDGKCAICSGKKGSSPSQASKPGEGEQQQAGAGSKSSKEAAAKAAAAAAAQAQQAAAARAQQAAAKMAGGGNSPAEASENVANAGTHMGHAGAQLAKQDVNGARPEQKEAMSKLLKAKQSLDDRIRDLKQQAGESAMDPQQAQDVSDALGEAMQQLQDAQRALQGANKPGGSDQAIADGQKHLDQAAKAAAEAAARADSKGVTDAAASALPKLSDASAEAAAGDAKDAAARAAEAQASLAEAQAALAVAQAQNGMQPGVKPGQQPGNSRGAVAQQQDEQSGKASDVKAPERGGSGNAEGERAADPNGAGSRNTVAGRGAYQGLPARDRQSLQQSQKDKYPEEYGPLIEQYLKSLAEEGKE